MLPITDQLCEQYPMLEEHKIIDVLLPKKEQMLQLKWYVWVCASRCELAHHSTNPIHVHSSSIIHNVPYTPHSPEKVSVIVVQNTPLFFSNREGKWMPTLRVLHQYPDMMPKLRADQGAIKFVLSGMGISRSRSATELCWCTLFFPGCLSSSVLICLLPA